MKRLIYSLILCLLVGGVAFAQDPGNQDSVIVRSAEVPLGVDSFFVYVMVVSDDSVKFYNLPLSFEYSGTGITYDTTFNDTAGVHYYTLLDGWDEKFDSLVTTPSGTFLRMIGFSDLGGPDNPVLITPGRYTAFRLKFLVEPNAPSQSITIGTIEDPVNGTMIFGLEGGLIQFEPAFVGGQILYGPTGTGDDPAGLPTDFALNQNYPNPFNPETNITFALPSAENVQISVYNLLGQHVKTVADANFDAGTHTVLWNGTNANGDQVPSGVYFYNMNAGDFSKTNKMVLIR